MNLLREIRPYNHRKQNKKKILKPFLTTILVACLCCGLLLYFKNNNTVKAYPFGLKNDYVKVMEMNQRLFNIAPIPVSQISTENEAGDKRIIALLVFLQQYKSPAATFSVAKAFVESADANGFGDRWQLLPAIAGVESGFCRLIPMENNRISHNCWGWGGPGNWFYFDSWEDAVTRISAGLAKGYGAANMVPETIVRNYCPPCYQYYLETGENRWANGVYQYMNEINKIYESIQ